jgi:Ran GTPase-activating protein (RanGAP) involved in mRNA processing and transport
MISGEGLELFLDDLIANTNIKHLDIGVLEGSMRKNSLGIQGAVCISAMLIRNKVVESLCINDNDFGPDGGECIGIALSQNETLKTLKIGENDLKSEGAVPIIKSATNLEVLSLAKNFMKSDVGKPLAKLLKTSRHLKKLYLEFNELMIQGAKWIAKGIQ